MYRVELKGDFHKGDLTANHISLSVYADGTTVWTIDAFDDRGNLIWQQMDL